MSGRAAIVIFGAAVRPDGRPSGALRGRVEAAITLGRMLDRPLYVPTGGQGRYGRPEAVVMRDMLLEAGVPAAAILVEATARNTLRSVAACRRLLAEWSGPVLVVTSGYHMLRCVVLLRLAGLRARAGRAATGAASARWQKRWFWRLREIPAVPLDVIQLVIWRSRGSLSK